MSDLGCAFALGALALGGLLVYLLGGHSWDAEDAEEQRSAARVRLGGTPGSGSFSGGMPGFGAGGMGSGLTGYSPLGDPFVPDLDTNTGRISAMEQAAVERSSGLQAAGMARSQAVTSAQLHRTLGTGPGIGSAWGEESDARRRRAAEADYERAMRRAEAEHERAVRLAEAEHERAVRSIEAEVRRREREREARNRRRATGGDPWSRL